MKVLYTNDWHLTDKRPLNRVDKEFFTTQFEKVEEILKIAKKYKVDVMYHGGDWFDHPRVDLWVINELIRLLSMYKIPIVTAIGNHDIFGYNIVSVKKSALGTLLRSGLVKISKHAVHIATNHTVDLYKNIDSNVIVTHNLVSPNPVPYPFILCKDLAPHVKGKIVLCGHKHWSFYYKDKANDCIMINTGCLVRTSVSEKNHMPYVVILDTETKKGGKVFLKCAKKGEDVFDLTSKKKQDTVKFDIDSFVQELKTTKFSRSDVMEVFNEFVKDKKVDKEVLDEACKRIEYASKK